MECKCKKCWYIASIILLAWLLALNVLLYIKQVKYLNYNIDQVGGIDNWNQIQKIYNSEKWKEEQTANIESQITQWKAQLQAIYNAGDTTSETNTDTTSEPNADVSAIVENLLATAPVRGDKNARFTIIEYTELLCPYCQRHSENGTIEAVMEKFPGEVNSVSRHYIIHGQTALELAAAMECVAELKSDVYYDVFEKAFEAYPVDMDGLKSIAVNLWVNESSLQSCIDDWKYLQSVSEMMSQWATVFGISGTPGNVIYDRETWKYQILPWAYPAENFIQIIESMK